ncbi:ComF family protein [Desulfurivibrio alkaliphilus]|uniref:Phosphoribosyltransferase n=1 Tax=Desulfurivibrio alkaliphilus (strain DSM 19089 / UNIQEM U267 / AHT2) TaxID=589865 RepID=D6Z553_DESAT|nr:ComF family protein [Desulfurivibrio alkaliphilus]ADH86678.1 phosphoribosyltransferase [Desulfurivibrio alkaliphilus AHT 2]
MALRLATIAQAVFAACQDILFPSSCLGCRAPLPASRLPLFCPPCRQQFQWLNSPLCPACGRPWPAGAGEDHLCGPCLQKPPLFQRARAAVVYRDPVAAAIQACKYQGDLAALSSLAALALHSPALDATRSAAIAASGYDFIVPVPLHLKRLRQRGFNQALLLARSIFTAQQGKIRFDLLSRERMTQPQTGMTGSQRRRNLKGAFVAPQPAMVRKRSLLLVDDVFTTGATVNECAKVLRQAGAARVDVFTLARVRE